MSLIISQPQIVQSDSVVKSSLGLVESQLLFAHTVVKLL